MKRTILALAIASFSIAATADPPSNIGPPTPIDVNVVNSSVPVTVGNSNVPVTVENDSLPVSIIPAWTPPSMLVSTGAGPTFIQPGDDNKSSGSPLLQSGPDRLLTGLTLQIFSRGYPADSGLCFAHIHIGEWSGADYVANEEMGLIATRSGGEATVFVPLPNVYVEYGDYLVTVSTNSTSTGCWVNAYAHMVLAESD